MINAKGKQNQSNIIITIADPDMPDTPYLFIFIMFIIILSSQSIHEKGDSGVSKTYKVLASRRDL
jgi:hypothetical protein